MIPCFLNWCGGKNVLRKWILYHLNQYQHKTYCEPFGGGAAVLLAKNPVACEVYNDIDGRLVDLFKVLADPRLFKKFQRIVSALPYSRKLFNDYKKELSMEQNIVKRAVMFFLLVRQSFSGHGRTYGYDLGKKNDVGGYNSCAKTWHNTVDMLPEFHERMKNVQIEHKPALDVIEVFDSPETLFYLDPPYILEKRADKNKGYNFEMSNGDHKTLVDKLLNIQGSAVLSGYEHDVYKPLIDNGWTIVKKKVCCSAIGRTKASGHQKQGSCSGESHYRTECLYLSPVTIRKDSLF